MSVLNPVITAFANKIGEKWLVAAALRAAPMKLAQAFNTGQRIKSVESKINVFSSTLKLRLLTLTLDSDSGLTYD